MESVELGGRVRAATSTGSIEGRVLIAASGGPPALFDELAPLVSPKLTFAVAARFAAGVPFADHLFWDCDEPYQYFRRLDEHTAIVGGADRDESTAHTGGDPHEQLRAFVAQRLGPSFDVTHRWSGSLFETTDGLPYIAAHPHHPDHLFFATGLSGNGMVMGALAGRLLAGLATGAADSPPGAAVRPRSHRDEDCEGDRLERSSRVRNVARLRARRIRSRCKAERGRARIGPVRDGGEDAVGDRQRGRPRVRARQPMHARGRQDV